MQACVLGFQDRMMMVFWFRKGPGGVPFSGKRCEVFENEKGAMVRDSTRLSQGHFPNFSSRFFAFLKARGSLLP